MKQQTQNQSKQYYFKNGNKKVSKKIADALEELSEDGKLTPIEVVDAARDITHPLHSYFEWDNSRAAELYRLAQARMLINQVEVILNVDGQETRFEKYVNVSLGEGARSYITIEKALSKEDYKKQIIATALAEAEYWQKKYLAYSELSPIFKSIKQTRNKLKGGKT